MVAARRGGGRPRTPCKRRAHTIAARRRRARRCNSDGSRGALTRLPRNRRRGRPSFGGGAHADATAAWRGWLSCHCHVAAKTEARRYAAVRTPTRWWRHRGGWGGDALVAMEGRTCSPLGGGVHADATATAQRCLYRACFAAAHVAARRSEVARMPKRERRRGRGS